jgi:hypothetical protein
MNKHAPSIVSSGIFTDGRFGGRTKADECCIEL